MSKTKEALKLAIEICEFYRGNGDNDIDKCLNACKEALAEQPSNMVTVPLDKLEDMQRRLKALDRMADNARELGLDYDEQEKPISRDWLGTVLERAEKDEAYRKGLIGELVQPLSDDEVFMICPYIDHDMLEEAFYRGFRAAEKAHKIGE